MNIHEYQGKEVLRKYGVAVPEGKVAFTADEAVKAAEALSRLGLCRERLKFTPADAVKLAGLKLQNQKKKSKPMRKNCWERRLSLTRRVPTANK